MTQNAEKMTSLQAFQKIEEKAKMSTAEPRFIRVIEVGQHIRQGDILITRIAKLPNGLKETQQLQLAEGNTQGSRHCLDSACTATTKIFIDPNTSDRLRGPFLQAGERFNITHPEHSHFSLPSGCYAVTFERDFAREERERVTD